MKQYNAIWPLPGGVTNYLEALCKVLRHIQTTSPLYDQMVQDYPGLFPGTDAEHVIRTQLLIPIHLGYAELSQGKYALTPDGAAIATADEPDRVAIYRRLADAHIGFNEVVEALRTQPMSLKDIHALLQQQVNPSWTHQAQPAYRVNWLRSLGLVEKDERGFTLTDLGRSIGAEKPSRPPVPPPPVPPVARTFAGQLTARLAELAKDSDHPTQFEEALRDAFEFLGFDAQKVGGAGEPDVIARASIDPNSYSVIVDAKTTSRGAISQGHVNLNALMDHKKKVRADYVAVVAIAFSGDNLPKWSREQNVRLIDVETLNQILLRHESTPFSLLDLKPLLAGGGVVDGTSIVDDLMRIADEIEEAQNLPARIFRTLLEKQAGCRARIDEHSLYFLLDEEYEVDDIRAALDLLRSPSIGAIVADERGGLSTRYSLRTFSARMNRIAAIATNGEEPAGPQEAG